MAAAAARRRAGLLLAVVVALCGAALGTRYVIAKRSLAELERRLAAELKHSEASYATDFELRNKAQRERMGREEKAHADRLRDQAVVSGEAAQANRAREWRKRVARDPEFAVTALERSLLKMQKVGSDPAIAAKEALEEVAKLAAPPGSRIEVTNAHDRFAVRVAFKLSATTPGEKGTRTKHLSVESLRREAEAISALVMKELYDYCGARGIARLSVSCNRAVYRHGLIPEAATPEEKKELEKRGAVVMSCIYRMSIDGTRADAVGSWREISVPRVLKMARLEFDGLSGLKIGDLPSDNILEHDPDMPLEF